MKKNYNKFCTLKTISHFIYDGRWYYSFIVWKNKKHSLSIVPRWTTVKSETMQNVLLRGKVVYLWIFDRVFNMF